MQAVVFNPIGVIHTPYKQPKGTPIQPWRSSHTRGIIEILPEYVPGLKDLDGFSHVVLLYHFHLSQAFELSVVPYLDDQPRGLFATRAPRRPNGIGLSVVRLLKVDGGSLEIENVDMVDGTPLLDIKPYVPHFEETETVRFGWLEGKAERASGTKADDRFSK